MLSEAFEMRELHRALLARNRMYLLHNLRPTEALLGSLMAREVLSHDMIDDVKSERTTTGKITRLMDLLPARGPQAFDGFCEALLESDHSHVAEYLKQLEATDNFRGEIAPHCVDISDHMMERFVNIFKKSTPTVSKFAEQKFQLILDEQDRFYKEKEAENQDLKNKLQMKELENSQLANFTGTCCSIVETLANEVQRDFLAKAFLRDEKKHIDNMKYSLEDITGMEDTVAFYRNMQIILTFLESHAGFQGRNGTRGVSARPRTGSRSKSAGKRSLREKMKIAWEMIVEMIENMGTRPQVPGALLRMELEKLLRLFQDLNKDVDTVTNALKATTEYKAKLEGEIVLLMHSNQEVRRIEREVKEKQTHISELTKNFNLLKRKGPGREHRKQLQQIHLNLQQRKVQSGELQKQLERQINSADVRLRHILSLLPDSQDENDNDLIRSDTDLTLGSSRLGTPDTMSLANDAIVNHKKLVEYQRIEKERRCREEEVEQEKEREEKERRLQEFAEKAKGGGEGGPLIAVEGGGLLQRRKLKQGRIGELKQETVRASGISPRKPGGSQTSNTTTGAQATKTGAAPKDKSQGQTKQNKAAFDVDKWVSQQQSQRKTAELHKKLAEFDPQPTADRTADLKRVLKHSSDEESGDNQDDKNLGDAAANGANHEKRHSPEKHNKENSSPPDQGKDQLSASPVKEGSTSSGHSGPGQGSRSSSGGGASHSGGDTAGNRKTSDISTESKKSQDSSTEKAGTDSLGTVNNKGQGQSQGQGHSQSKYTNSKKVPTSTHPGQEKSFMLAAGSHVAVLDPNVPNHGGRKSQAQRMDGEVQKKVQPQPQGRQALAIGTLDLRLPSK